MLWQACVSSAAAADGEFMPRLIRQPQICQPTYDHHGCRIQGKLYTSGSPTWSARTLELDHANVGTLSFVGPEMAAIGRAPEEMSAAFIHDARVYCGRWWTRGGQRRDITDTLARPS